MDEPTYIAQNGDLENYAAIHDWFRARSEEARSTGEADHFRYSEHPDIPKLVLVEGWRGPPEGWMYGAPRWALTAAKAA